MNTKLKIFCVTNKLVPNIEGTSLILAGVGKQNFSKQYIDSSIKNNIFDKEKYYSELTFHYWYWKNLLQDERSDWVGFCQRRRFWIKRKSKIIDINSKNFVDHILTEPHLSWDQHNSIICNPINISGAKKIKLIKRGWKNLIKNPSIFFNKNKENIKLHFDMHHGYGNLDKAINVLDSNDREDFRNFVNLKSEYNPHIMFIARPEIIDKWFLTLFTWLERCEDIFGFEGLKGYDTQRLYAYLAERYLSFWFKKNTNFLEWPWIFVDN